MEEPERIRTDTLDACFRGARNLTKDDLPLERSKDYQTKLDIDVGFSSPVPNDTILDFEYVVEADAKTDLLDHLG